MGIAISISCYSNITYGGMRNQGVNVNLQSESRQNSGNNSKGINLKNMFEMLRSVCNYIKTNEYNNQSLNKDIWQKLINSGVIIVILQNGNKKLIVTNELHTEVIMQQARPSATMIKTNIAYPKNYRQEY